MVDTKPKLRLLYIPSHFPPSATAGVHRVMRVCRYLPKNTFEIEVLSRNLAPTPGGQELLDLVDKSLAIHRANLRNSSSSLGSSNEGSKPLITSSNSSALRSFLKWGRRPLRYAKELLLETPDKHVAWTKPMVQLGRDLCSIGNFDVLMTSGPPHSIHLVGLALSKEFGIPWVADFRDPWARRPWDVVHNPWGQRLLPRYEREVVSNADAVLLNTKATHIDFTAVYKDLPATRFHWVPNGMDPELPATIDPMINAFTAHANGERRAITLCHAGSLYGNRRPDGLLEAMAMLKAQGVACRLMQIGSVDHLQIMLEKIEKLGLREDVTCMPPVPHSEVLERMAEVDLHVVLQPDGPLMIPGKVYEMIAFPQPIVAICDSPVTIEVVEQAGGTHAASRDVPGIATAILEASRMRHDPKFAQIRAAARQQFDGQKIVERLGDILRSVARSQEPGETE
jgi:glycosyltransferase involved in cell wall biosynthesis